MDHFIILADTEAGPLTQTGQSTGQTNAVTGGNAGTTTQPTPAGGQAAPSGGIFGSPVFLIVMMLLLVWFMIIRPKKKEEKAKKDLMAGIKKGDKVVTIGGIMGTVMDLREDEVVLKVDESSNTRIRFARAAISRVVGEEKGN